MKQLLSIDPEEEWRPVPGFEENYQVSNLGRIRSNPLGPGRNHDKGRVRKLNPAGGGYLSVVLTNRRGKRELVKVHRAVCEAFHGPAPEGKPLVLHSNGDKLDNRPENLRWGSHADNSKDSVIHGTHPETRKTHCPQGHEYTPENTYRARGKRECRHCRRYRFANLPEADPRHGRISTYKGGCRCNTCRTENARVVRERKQRDQALVGR